MASTSTHFFVNHSTVSGLKWNASVVNSQERNSRSCACRSPDSDFIRPVAISSLSISNLSANASLSTPKLHSITSFESFTPGLSHLSCRYSRSFKRISCTKCGLGSGSSTSVEEDTVSNSLSNEEASSSNALGSGTETDILAPIPSQNPTNGAQLAEKPVFQINRPAPIPLPRPSPPSNAQPVTGNKHGNSYSRNDTYRPNSFRPGQNGNGGQNSKFVYKPRFSREGGDTINSSERSIEESSDKVIMSLKEILEKAEKMGTKSENPTQFFQRENQSVSDESVQLFTMEELEKVSEKNGFDNSSASVDSVRNEEASSEAMMEIQKILDAVAEEKEKVKIQPNREASDIFIWNSETIDSVLSTVGKDDTVDEALENIVSLHKTMATPLPVSTPNPLSPDSSLGDQETPAQVISTEASTVFTEANISSFEKDSATNSVEVKRISSINNETEPPIVSPKRPDITLFSPSPPILPSPTLPNLSSPPIPRPAINTQNRKIERIIKPKADRWERNSNSVYRPPKPTVQVGTEPQKDELQLAVAETSIDFDENSVNDVTAVENGGEEVTEEKKTVEEEEEGEVIVRPKPMRIERVNKPVSPPSIKPRVPSETITSGSYMAVPYKPTPANREDNASSQPIMSKPSFPSPPTAPTPPAAPPPAAPAARKGPILLDTGRIIRPASASASATIAPAELAGASPSKPAKALSKLKDGWKKKDGGNEGIKSKKGGKGGMGEDRDGQKRGKRESKAGRKAARIELAKANAPVRVEILEVGKQGMTVNELASLLAINDSDVIKTLFIKGVVTTVNQTLDEDTVRIVCNEYDVEVIEAGSVKIEDMAKKGREFIDLEDLDNLILRPPVVTIMGHVDHGKTSLLDYIRKSKVVDGEAGGITQGIGAYSVQVNVGGEEQTCVFLDTPGHEAFSAMRARGAKVTDIAIIVVAADDGIRPQTLEAIAHAKAANVPIIIAINKIDKEGANPDKVMQELASNNLMPEEWGGDVPMVQVSAKAGTNIEALLETVILVAEIQDLHANPDRLALGTVIEASLDKFKGPVATLLVQNGTLKKGDVVLCGESYGRVKALMDDVGNKPDSAGPSMAVEVLGLSSVPVAGDEFEVLTSLDEAKERAESNGFKLRDERLTAQGGEGRVTLASLASTMASSPSSDSVEHHTVNVVLKVDAQGSVEAIREALSSLPQDTVRLRFLLQSTGDVSFSDVDLASASNAIVLGFNVSFPTAIEAHAQVRGVEVRNYKVIYDLIDDMRKAMEGMLETVDERTPLGKAEVRQVFGSGSTKVAGCMVLEGKLVKGCTVSVTRGGKEIYVGKLNSLRRVKELAKEVAAGLECGVGVEGFDDWSEADTIEAFDLVSKSRSLEEASKASSAVLASKAEILSA